MRIAVVSFADDRTERYRNGLIRAENSIKTYNPEIDYIGYKSFDEIKSPTHDEVPYGFKAYAIQDAKNKGYDIVLWFDSIVYATKNINEVINHIINNGYVFFQNYGYSIADYTSDKCLEIMDISREEAKKFHMIMACCMGFNFNYNPINLLFDEYFNHTKTGAFIGPWINKNNELSNDIECKGHRHDQSVISILIKKYNLNIINGNETFFSYYLDTTPRSESVCLLTE